MDTIKLGYEIGTGETVEINPSHLIVTGITQLSGKTTTLEALISRSGSKAIVFKTKPGEKSFTLGTEVAPLEKIKRDFIEEIRLRIIEDIKSLTADEKKALRYIESKDADIAANEIITKCFLWSPGNSTSVKMSNIFKPLSSNEFIEKTAGGRYRKSLKKRIETLIAGHDASAEEIDLLYNHLLTELI